MKKTDGNGTMIFLAIIALAFLIYGIMHPSPNHPNSSDILQKIEWRKAAENIIQSYLKAPSTAAFNYDNIPDPYQSPNGIIVKGYVDAENSFGAKLRRSFMVILDSSGTNAQSIRIDDEYIK